MSDVEEAVATRTRSQVAARGGRFESKSRSDAGSDESLERRGSPSRWGPSGGQPTEPALERYLRLGREIGLSGLELAAFAERREESERAERIRLEELRHDVEIARARSVAERKDAPGIQGDVVRLKIPPFDEKEDLETYLCRFERWAKLQQWDLSTWAIRLGVLLRGKASEVYIGLSDSDAEDYQKLKAALLARFRLTAESYRRKLRASRREGGETFQQYLARIRLYLARWMDLAGKAATFESLKDLVLMEQLLDSVPLDLATFIRERAPKDVDDAAVLAQQFSDARVAARSHRTDPTTRPQKSEQQERRSEPRFPDDQKQENKACFHCGKVGHYRAECPKLPKSSDDKVALGSTITLATVRAVDQEVRSGTLLDRRCRRSAYCDFRTQVTLNSHEVSAVRDTGADLLCVRRVLVDPKDLTHRKQRVRYASTDTQWVPLAYVRLESPYYSGEVEAAVFPDLIEGVLIGNTMRTKEGKEIQVPVYEEHAATCARVKTCMQMRSAETEKAPLQKLEIHAHELSMLQSTDESLRHIRTVAHQRRPPVQRGTGVVSFQHEGGLLWRKYTGGNGVVHKQVVVPVPLRADVLKMAHD
ncbi:uncharacterized protein LOC112574993 [Pomacea canaliculata]|uniref:uncharacterized protein LOC112574993 n=1 Tax=Pomacea canaliculata TaxID=400727 RepID=UPI000D73C62D|nr:uncharacterized protein LOC112574993 [Pomacea canaliculata]